MLARMVEEQTLSFLRRALGGGAAAAWNPNQAPFEIAWEFQLLMNQLT